MTVKILTGDCRDVLKTLAPQSVHMVCTSPPYFGLRDYGTTEWSGGDPDHEHDRVGARNGRGGSGTPGKQTTGAFPSTVPVNKCSCGAVRVDRQIGLEETPAAYVAEMVAVFREVWRVLRDDGTVWLNLGDSYNSVGGGYNEHGSRGVTAAVCASTQAAVVKGRNRGGHAGLKPKDLMGIPWRVAFALQDDGWYLRRDIIWCLSGGTRVYARTQKGEMPMSIKDMVRLDPSTVQLWNGEKWTQVLGWSQTPRPDVTYEIELRNGQRIGCTGNHEWPTLRGNVRTDQLHTTESLFPADVIQSCRLPEPSDPRQPSALDDETVGWFVGLYIAEGSQFEGTIQIASHIKEISRFERLILLASAFHGSAAVHKTSENGCTVSVNGPMLCGIIETYVSGRIASDKHLHPRCWQRSDKFLRAVIDGYLSGDGHWDEPNQRWRLGFCANDELVADLRTIGARLGITVRLRRVINKLGYTEFPGYKGEVRFSRSIHHNNRHDGEVVAIRESRARKFWDIGVADEPHLFALASGILTHNSKPNPMPESTTDRPTTAHEYVFLLTKSGGSLFWTHRDGPGTRKRPAPDYRWVHRMTSEERATAPDGWPEIGKAIWRRVNLWSAHDYFYDAEAVREPDAGQDHSRNVVAPVNRSAGHLADDKGIRTSEGRNGQGRNLRSVWTIATAPFAESHFATFAPKLADTCIRAGTSERGACPACAAPWARTITKGEPDEAYRAACGADASGGYGGQSTKNHDAAGVQNASNVKRRILDGLRKKTYGWQPTCECPPADPVPCVVLDPFGGAGTVGMVADRLQQDAILIELNPEYVTIMRKRIEGDAGMFAQVAAE